MTKVFEQYTVFRLADLPQMDVPEKGEYVVLLRPGQTVAAEAWTEEVRLRLAPDKEWAKSVAARHDLSASEIYNALQRLKAENKDS